MMVMRMKKLNKYLKDWKENQDADTLNNILKEVYEIKDNKKRAEILLKVKPINDDKFMELCMNELYDNWKKIVNDGFGEYILNESLKEGD
jgi:hypothetical protein